MTVLARSCGAALLLVALGGWPVGFQGSAGAAEHYARALGAVTAEQGRQAPDFSLEDLAGKVHRLREYRGKVVLLGFGATW
ncbi:MAG TPA: hypothetical protein DCQ64_19445 [Candidatus Rokubacteria bacterium]|nr:MAG: hypothetical protein A2X53_06800 [Candidatus Rokubacteria bacterium GWA2_70_23]OGK91061.1 MAG: hypothetical protein A2X50_04805 [Candidatus Rokubacteria bacterium GWF2_70_14]HAM57463.1 hypothetical protein [Candidatus Rokubacteria bacterium]